MGETGVALAATGAAKANARERAERLLGQRLQAQHGVVTRAQILE